MSRPRPQLAALFVMVLTGGIVLSGLAAVGSSAFDQQKADSQSLTDSIASNGPLTTAANNATTPPRETAWPNPCANAANTCHLNTTGPTDPFTVRWKFSDTVGREITGAVVKNGTVYFGAGKRLYAVDAWTGEKLLNVSLRGPAKTPAVFRDTVYVHTNGGWMYAMNRSTGEIYWEFSTGEFGRAPRVTNRTVYLEGDDTLYALSALTGNVQWSHTLKKASWGWGTAPGVGDGTVYVGEYLGKVYALDAETGHVQWTFDTGIKWPSTPVVANGLVYVGGNRQPHIYAIDAETGSEHWHRTIAGSKGVRPPTVVGNSAYISTGDDGLYAVDAMSGETRWHIDSPSSKPAAANGTVYVRPGAIKPQGEPTRSVYALDAETGTEITRFTLDDPNAKTDSRPTVHNGSLYIGYGFKEQGTKYHVDRTALYALGTPEFTYSDLSVTSRSVEINESITVTATVTNTGTGPGEYNATMVVNDTVVDATIDQLEAGTSTTVEFTGTFSENGTYTVGIAGLKRTIAVGDVAPPPTPTPTPTGATTQTASSPSGPSPTEPATTPTPTTTPGFGVGIFAVALAVVVGVIVGRRRS